MMLSVKCSVSATETQSLLVTIDVIISPKYKLLYPLSLPDNIWINTNMDGEDFDDDDYDIDFVINASNKVKEKWAKTSLDKDLRDVTNTTYDDDCAEGSTRKKKSKRSNKIVGNMPVTKIVNESLEVSDEEEISGKNKETTLDITITPPGSPTSSPPSTEKPTRGSRRTKKTEQALKKIQKSKVRNDMLRSADQRLAQVDREIMSEELRKRHLVIEDDTLELKVRWKAEVFRLEVKKADKMSKVMEQVAEKAGIAAKDLSIYKDQVSGVPLPRDATVKSQGLSIVSFLHARAKVVTPGELSKSPGEGGIELKLQTKDRRAQPVTVNIDLSDKMEVVIQKYCDETNLKKEKVKFFFDGEHLNPEDTAEDLDLEGGECIDVHVNEK